MITRKRDAATEYRSYRRMLIANEMCPAKLAGALMSEMLLRGVSAYRCCEYSGPSDPLRKNSKFWICVLHNLELIRVGNAASHVDYSRAESLYLLALVKNTPADAVSKGRIERMILDSVAIAPLQQSNPCA